jgi:hypothetical protein
VGLHGVRVVEACGRVREVDAARAVCVTGLLLCSTLGFASEGAAQGREGIRPRSGAAHRAHPSTLDEGVWFGKSRYAAYRGHAGPDVAVHFVHDHPAPRPLRAVVFLHGWNGCVRVLALRGSVACVPSVESGAEGRRPARRSVGWGLAAAHQRSGVASVLVIPQLAFHQRVTDPGAFKQAGVFQLFLDDVLRQRSREWAFASGSESLGFDDVESLTLVAHSAGYAAALAILRQPELRLKTRDVVLLDALYAGADEFSEWLCESPARRTLVSLYTGKATTFRQNQALVRGVRKCVDASKVRVEPPSLPNAVKHSAATIARTSIAHGEIPKRMLAELLTWLPDGAASANASTKKD